MIENNLIPAATSSTVAECMRTAQSIAAGAADIVVDSPEMYTIAGDELARVKKAISTLDEKRLSITRPMDEAKKNVMALFKPALDQLDGLKTNIERGMLTWKKADDARVAKERADAERKQQEERERQERIAAEERKRAEELLAKAGDGKGKAAEKARQQAEEAARRAQEAAEQAELAEVASPLPVASGAVSTRSSAVTRWTVEDDGVNLAELVAGAAANPDLLIYLKADMVQLRAIATALKGHARVPGVTFKPVESIRSR